MNDKRTFRELTSDELNELKIIMLFSDDEEFYEDIDEISYASVENKFGKMSFSKEDFSCNLIA
ncbi:MAG: hypothetical protein K6F83_01775 [Clostridiales bacterium]|nr:hypothetical protein [Clostridiales bacterium]